MSRAAPRAAARSRLRPAWVGGATVALGRVLACACVAAALAGCDEIDANAAIAAPAFSGTPAQQEALHALHRAALDHGEREIVVYGAASDREVDPIWIAFARAVPGLRVVYLHVSPHQLMPRVDAEAATGRRFGDLSLQPITVSPEIARRGYLESWAPPNAQALPADYRDPEDRVHYAFSKVYGLGYNTDQVAPGALPAHLADVLAPAWRDRFSYVMPTSIVGTTDVSIATLLRDGAATPPQLRGLAANGVMLGPDNGVTYLAQGRQWLNLWAYLPSVLRMRALGAPVDVRFVPDFSVDVPFGLGLLRGAPHPQAARLLKAWLLSPDGQRALADEAYMLGSMPDAPAPPLYPPPGPERDALHRRPPPPELTARIDRQRDELRAIFRNARQQR